MSNQKKLTSAVLADWLAVIKQAKAPNTLKTYRTAAESFKLSLGRDKAIESLSENDYETFLSYLKGMHPQTEKLYAIILALFFEYLSAKSICKINMDAIRYMRRNQTRKAGKRLRKIDMDALHEIAEKVVSLKPGDDPVLARAKCLVIWLVRSGLRAFEAVNVKTTDLDPRKGRGITIGKGNKEAYFLLDDDMLDAMREYHRIREVKSEWVFLSHSRRHGKTHTPIAYDTARRDVMRIYGLLLENDPEFRITPHQFRHFFVTEVYRETGDIKEAQTAARHDNIATTDRYIHDEEGAILRVGKTMRKARGK